MKSLFGMFPRKVSSTPGDRKPISGNCPQIYKAAGKDQPSRQKSLYQRKHLLGLGLEKVWVKEVEITALTCDRRIIWLCLV